MYREKNYLIFYLSLHSFFQCFNYVVLGRYAIAYKQKLVLNYHPPQSNISLDWVNLITGELCAFPELRCTPP